MKKRRGLQRKAHYFTYILECGDGTYYTGHTSDLEKRIEKHNSGKGAKYTRARKPVKLAWFKKYKYYKCAFNKEIELKKLTREQKEHLVKRTK
ncbi:MAG: GIY-YIG nuclease family protein [Spirochaetes bacterium]|nr:GIY-YIG nuclease family protein [Spirochaetota bacterium]